MLNNYGAILQAFALQSYLQKNPERDVEIIHFETNYHRRANRIFACSNAGWLYGMLICLLTIWRYPQLKRKELRIKKFKRRYFRLTPTLYDTEEMLLSTPPFEDIYITGSDQVFNPNHRYMKAYYLGFAKGNSQKASFAASFGISKFDEEMVRQITPYIADFDILSCREFDGTKLLAEISGREVPTLLDPVFLLNENEWKIISVSPELSKYIFVYDLNGGDDLLHVAHTISVATGLSVICLTQKVYKFYKVTKQIYDAGPCEFLGYIRNAEYVVTDSFHGTAFSIIFKRNFYTYIALPASANRIYNLLDTCAMTNRVVANGKSRDFVFVPSGTEAPDQEFGSKIIAAQEFIKANF